MRFYLSGDPIDLAILRDQFPERPGTNVWFGEDELGTYLVSETIAGIPEASDRHRAAEAVLARAVGLGRLLDSDLRPVALDGRRVDSTGRHHHVVVLDTAVERDTALAGTVLIDGVPVEEPPSPAPDMLALAQTTAVVDEVLELVGSSNLNWADLYKVYEIVRDDVVGGVEGIHSNGWATKDEQSTFRASANRKDVSGSAARHARSRGDKMPKAVMTLPEGQAFIRRLASEWLRSHVAGPGS